MMEDDWNERMRRPMNPRFAAFLLISNGVVFFFCLGHAPLWLCLCWGGLWAVQFLYDCALGLTPAQGCFGAAVDWGIRFLWLGMVASSIWSCV